MKNSRNKRSYLKTVKEVEEAIKSLKNKGLVVENGGSYELTLEGLECARCADLPDIIRGEYEANE